MKEARFKSDEVSDCISYVWQILEASLLGTEGRLRIGWDWGLGQWRRHLNRRENEETQWVDRNSL